MCCFKPLVLCQFVRAANWELQQFPKMSPKVGSVYPWCSSEKSHVVCASGCDLEANVWHLNRSGLGLGFGGSYCNQSTGYCGWVLGYTALFSGACTLLGPHSPLGLTSTTKASQITLSILFVGSERLLCLGHKCRIAILIWFSFHNEAFICSLK